MTAHASTPLSPEDLSFWYPTSRDSVPRLAMLLLDRRPDPALAARRSVAHGARGASRAFLVPA